MSLEIIPATRRHFYTLTVLTKRFFPYTGFSFEELKRRTSSPNIKYLVAELNSATVGFADYEIIPASPESPCKCKLIGLAVVEEHRGKGVARKLLEKVVEEGKKATCVKIFLLVAEDNALAIKLYNSFGFVSKGRTELKLSGKHILLMEKLL